MRDYILLVLAILIRFIIEVPLLIRGIYKWGPEFAFNIALDIDREGETLFWNSGTTHTISARVYDKKKWWAVKLIDWIFREHNHCYNAWISEFHSNVPVNRDNGL